ncbi:MAG: hypothetical protein AB7O28_04555 [Vicinamibacterales bacterium]
MNLLLASVPLILLGLRNWRAVPLGALIMAFSGIGSLGLLSGLDVRGLVVLAVVLLVIAAAFFFTLRAAGGTPWILWSMGAWVVAAAIFAVDGQPSVDEFMRRRSAAFDAELTARNAEVQARREQAEAEANRPRFLAPDQRAAMLDQLLERTRARRAGTNLLPISRFLRFGDPVARPESVVVWAVYPSIPGLNFCDHGGATWYLYHELNRDLHLAGYPNPVGLGAVSEDVLRDAGGDEAYLGSRGELREPQFHERRHAEGVVRRFSFPRAA